jgi:hypothetical protein
MPGGGIDFLVTIYVYDNISRTPATCPTVSSHVLWLLTT